MGLYQGDKLLTSVAVNQIIEGTDVSDATISSGDVVSGKVGYGASGKIYGKLRTDSIWCSAGNFSLPSLCMDDSADEIIVSQAEFGDATADQVLNGITFTSNNGRLLTGTMKSSTVKYGSVTANSNSSITIPYDISSAEYVKLALASSKNIFVIGSQAGGGDPTLLSINYMPQYYSGIANILYYDGIDYYTQIASPSVYHSSNSDSSTIYIAGSGAAIPSGAIYYYIID